MLPFLLGETANLEQVLPLYVCIVGNHAQKHLARPDGYPAHQIFLSRSGSGIFRIKDQPELVLMPGTLLLLPADTPHDYYPCRSDEIWDLGFVAFNGSAAGPLLEQMREMAMKAVPVPNFDSLWEQLESLWHVIGSNGEQAYWESSRRLYGMVLSILEGQYAGIRPRRNVYPSGQSNAALQTAIQLIHDHCNERLLLTNVARAAGYSVQHFHRLFVESFGITPQQYILQLRMRSAVRLFEEQPGIAVEKAAEMVGMDVSYFIRMFKRTYGTTPKQYLKKGEH